MALASRFAAALAPPIGGLCLLKARIASDISVDTWLDV